MSILIKNGLVVDPSKDIIKEQDVLIKDNRVAKVASNINEKADQVIEAKNKIVMPGIVDMHVHLREPGREDKETVFSATTAALKGGVTSLLAMPNTYPAIDSAANVKLLKEIIKKTAQSNVFIAGAITVGRLGKEPVDVGRLKKEGVIAITDDGCSVDDEKIFQKALREAQNQNVLVICHCEDKMISRGGVVNLGFISTILGLKGIPNEAEYKRIERDIELAGKIGVPIHIVHVSCRESVDIIASAKKKGIRLSAETAPHYFTLDDTALLEYDTNKKINPPLRNKMDVEHIKEGLKSGVIDCIASDHAPHTDNEKDIEFDRAEFGAIGLETELAVSITELIKPGLLTWTELAKKMSLNPARLLGLDKGTLKEGGVADIIVVDSDKEWVVRRLDFVSKSKNSPFIGKSLRGCVECTILGGEIVYRQ